MPYTSEPPQEIKTRTSVYTRRPDGIIVQRICPEINQTLADARENAVALARIAIRPKHPVLVDMRAPFSIDNDARAYYASPEAILRVSALAMLIQSRTGRLIGNLYLSVNAPKVPTWMFTGEADAVSWLLKSSRELVGAGRS